MKINSISNDLIDEKIEGAYKFPYYFICHRIPERTLKFRGRLFPICARCTGIYISAISYFIYVAYVPVTYNLQMVLLAIGLMFPAFLDGTTQLFSLRDSNNLLRVTTGLLAGLGLGILSKAFKHMILT